MSPLQAGLDGLLLAALLVAWGAQVTIPARLPRVARAIPAALEAPESGGTPGTPGTPVRHRAWALAIPLLFLAGAFCALIYARFHTDSVLAAGLFPLRASIPGQLLSVLAPSLLGASIVTFLGWRKMENAGWWILAGFGLAFLAVAALAMELLRSGEPFTGLFPALAVGAGCRLLIALGAGELASPGRPLLALPAGLALAGYWTVLTPRIAAILAGRGQALTCGAAVLLFLAVRWLPVRLRRPALIGAVVLAALFLAQAELVTLELANQPESPMPPP